MRLFHGNNVEVREPKILPRLRALDFGAGFYTTSSRDQARQWAKSVVKRAKRGSPVVCSYEIDDGAFENLSVLKFAEANGDWLDFVVANRKRLPILEKRDLVIGPVANDSTLEVIDYYMRGVFTKAYAIERLKPQNLTGQYAFLSERAVSFLGFLGAEEVE